MEADDRRSKSQAASGSTPVDLWDRRARLYDLQLFLEKPALRAAIKLGDPSSDDSVLDLGTGTGALLRELARGAPRPEHVVSVDASTRMLERARSARLPRGWRLEQADARRLPFDDESFSLVFAAYLLNVLSDEDARVVLHEAHRVLASGGRVVVISPAEPSSPLARPYRNLARVLPALVPRFCAGIRLLDPEPLMRAADLEPAKRRYVRLGYPSLCVLAIREGLPGSTPPQRSSATARVSSPSD